MPHLHAKSFSAVEGYLRTPTRPGERPATLIVDRSPSEYLIRHPDLEFGISVPVGSFSDEVTQSFGLSQSQGQEGADQAKETSCLTNPSGTPVQGPTERAHEHAESALTRLVSSASTVSTFVDNVSERRQPILASSSTVNCGSSNEAVDFGERVIDYIDGGPYYRLNSSDEIPLPDIFDREAPSRWPVLVAEFVQRPLIAVVDGTRHGVQAVARRFRNCRREVTRVWRDHRLRRRGSNN